MFSFRVGALVLLISGSAAMAATEEYQVSLGPAARTNATQLIAVGGGAVKVSYDGQQLSIDGTFGGLVSPATDAHLCQGMGIGRGRHLRPSARRLAGHIRHRQRQDHAHLRAAESVACRPALYPDQQREGACACRQSLGLDPDRP